MRTFSAFTKLALGSCLLVLVAVPASPQAAAPAKPAVGSAVPPAQVYGKLLTQLEKEFVDAAEAMPEDKFNFAPPTTAGEFKGVRSFSGQIKHIAEANYYFFGGTAFTEAEGKAKSDAIEKLSSRAEILQALKDSFIVAHKYIDGITAENAFISTDHGTRGGMAAFGIAHLMDHYGQLVVYLRMNGIVPPASRSAS